MGAVNFVIIDLILPTELYLQNFQYFQKKFLKWKKTFLL
jgi:hypothetical protein